MGRAARIWLTAGLAVAMIASQVPAGLFTATQALGANDITTPAPASYDFSTHLVGGAGLGSITVTFTNQSTQTLVNAPIAKEGSNAADFASSKANCGPAISPGATCCLPAARPANPGGAL